MRQPTPEEAHEVKVLLQQGAKEFQYYETLQKIDWMKLFELIMKLLPLILTFFKPQDEEPKT